MFDKARLRTLGSKSLEGTPWRTHTRPALCYTKTLLPLLAPPPALLEGAEEDVRAEFVAPPISITYQGMYNPVEEMIPMAPPRITSILSGRYLVTRLGSLARWSRGWRGVWTPFTTSW